MKYKFKVFFADMGHETIHADTESQAIILAQAKRIKKGLNFQWTYVIMLYA